MIKSTSTRKDSVWKTVLQAFWSDATHFVQQSSFFLLLHLAVSVQLCKHAKDAFEVKQTNEDEDQKEIAALVEEERKKRILGNNPICLIEFMGVIKMVFLSGRRCKVCSILATAGLMGPVKASSSNYCTYLEGRFTTQVNGRQHTVLFVTKADQIDVAFFDSVGRFYRCGVHFAQQSYFVVLVEVESQLDNTPSTDPTSHNYVLIRYFKWLPIVQSLQLISDC